MRKQLICSGFSLVGLAFLVGLAACSGNASHPGAHADGAQPDAGQGCNAGAPNSSYVLIDDMETTTHGPIDIDAGIRPPLSTGLLVQQRRRLFR